MKNFLIATSVLISTIPAYSQTIYRPTTSGLHSKITKGAWSLTANFKTSTR